MEILDGFFKFQTIIASLTILWIAGSYAFEKIALVWNQVGKIAKDFKTFIF